MAPPSNGNPSKYIRTVEEHDVLLGTNVIPISFRIKIYKSSACAFSTFRTSHQSLLLLYISKGRGTGPNEHPGNKQYRNFCLQRKDEYTKTSIRSEKNEIAKWVFDQVIENGGRFIKQVEVAGPSFPRDEAVYMEVEKQVALEKIRQSLRQALNRSKSTPLKNGTRGTSDSSISGTSITGVSSVAEDEAMGSPASTLKPQESSKKTSVVVADKQDSRPSPNPNDLQRYKLLLSYDGTRYKGWQRQSSSSSVQDGFTSTSAKNTHNLKKRKYDEKGRVVSIPLTVQESLEDALEMYSGLDRPSLRVRMAGRTDAGVHARGQVVVVSLPKPQSKSSISPDIEFWQVRKSINSRLPRDLCIDDVSTCDPSFDPRKDVVLKQYSYIMRYFRRNEDLKGNVANAAPVTFKGGPELLRSAFDDGRCWLVPWALDDSKLEDYCKLLSGDHDFTAFVHKNCRTERDNCKPVTRFACKHLQTAVQEGGATVCDVRFEVESQGFGRSQIRNFVGFIVDLCRGSIQDYDTVEDWLWKTDPAKVSNMINAAPACGLCLEWVKYADKQETSPSSDEPEQS